MNDQPTPAQRPPLDLKAEDCSYRDDVAHDHDECLEHIADEHAAATKPPPTPATDDFPLATSIAKALDLDGAS